jgi:hypothetical protein
MSRAEIKLTATKRWFNLVTGSVCIACFLTASLATASAQEQTASTVEAAILPSLDSINAQTDITVFLHSGVPARLRLAALRRAWTVDPAIRDFRGLQESDWDFGDPESILGFGELSPEIDVRQMVAELLTDVPPATARPPRMLRAILGVFRPI